MSQSKILNNLFIINRIDGIIQLINTIYKFEKDPNNIEKLHIPNSKLYLDYMKILSFDVFYKDFYDEACLSYKQTEYLKTLDKNKSVLNEINSEKEKIIKNCISKGKHDFLNQYDLKIKNVFKHPIKETFINLYSNNKSNSNDINIRSFQSTLTIFDELTEISEKICKLKDDQFEVLVTEVNKINNNLPCNGYVPFLKESVRKIF